MNADAISSDRRMASADVPTDVMEANNAWRGNRAPNRSRKNRIKLKPDDAYPGWVKHTLDARIVTGKDPNDVSKIARTKKMSILVWEILYNNGERVSEILDRYPDLLNHTTFAGDESAKDIVQIPPITAAVFKDNLRAATELARRGADLAAKSSMDDGITDSRTTSIFRAMINPAKQEIFGLLMHYASNNAKLEVLSEAASLPKYGKADRSMARDRIWALAEALDANSQFSDETVKWIISFSLESKPADRETIDMFARRFRHFMWGRTMRMFIPTAMYKSDFVTFQEENKEEIQCYDCNEIIGGFILITSDNIPKIAVCTI